jgi:hypothetical protein
MKMPGEGNAMAPLQNVAIERPELTFEVELVIFGSVTHTAVKRTVMVLAQTMKGARRICKARYRRSEIKGVKAKNFVFADFFGTGMPASAHRM